METVLLTVVVFCVIIFIHELGHFIAAKACGVKVLEFSLGMGIKIFQYQKKPKEDIFDENGNLIQNQNTKYTIRLLPIGGYVSMDGEDTDSADKCAFCNQKAWKRLIIVSAGAIMNLVLGFVVLFIAYSSMDRIPTTTIALFNENATSSSYGLQVGDDIKKVNGKFVFNDGDLLFELLNDDDGTMDIEVVREGKKLLLEDVQFKTEGQSLDIDFKVNSKPKDILSLSAYTLSREASNVKLVLASLEQLVTGKVGFSQLSGPVGVGSVIGEAAAMSFASLLSLVGFLTVNIGIFNVLPLPALDGGRIVFILIEMIRRKPLNPKYEGIVHTVGILVLFLIMILVTFKDIFNLVG